MKKFITVLILSAPAFAQPFHYVGRTLKPTGQVVVYVAKGIEKGAKAVVKDGGKAVVAVVKTVF